MGKSIPGFCQVFVGVESRQNTNISNYLIATVCQLVNKVQKVTPLLGVSPVCMSVHHAPAWCLQKPEECTASPRTELQTVVTHQVGAGSQNSSSGRAASAFNC